MSVFRKPFPFNDLPSSGKRITQPSLTVPGQSYSVDEVISRASRGLPFGNSFPHYYDSDNGVDLPDLSRMDKVERIETAREFDSRFKQMKFDFDKASKAPAPAPNPNVEE